MNGRAPDTSLANIRELKRNAIRAQAKRLTPPGNFYFKTLRVDMKGANNYYYPNYFFSFIMELIDPVKYSFPKRWGEKRNFTVTGEGIFTRKTHYQHLAPLKTAQYTQEAKKGYTHFQPATLANSSDLLPSPCAFNGYKTLLAGVIIEEKDVLVSNRLYTQDGDTFSRPYDFFLYEEALQYQKNNADILYPANKTKEYIAALRNKQNHSHGEPLVRFRWNVDGSFKISIMEDNLESRLLAKEYAIHFGKKLYEEKVCHASYTMPIVFYTPHNHELLFKEYTHGEYELDCEEAREIYENDAIRKQKYEQGRFEFLLGLSIQKQKQTLLTKTNEFTSDTLALTLLKKNNIFIFKSLKENTRLSFDALLKPDISSMKSEDILSLFDYALRADYDELACYLYNYLSFDKEQSHDILYYVLEKNKYAWFKKLLKANIIDRDPSSGTTILHHAAEKQDPRYIKALLKYKNSPIHIDNENVRGQTPLMIAAFNGSVKGVETLLNNDRVKSNINYRNKNGDTALMYAAFTGENETLAVLLKNNQIDFLNKNQQGLSAYDFTKSRNDKVSMHLLEDKAKQLQQNPVFPSHQSGFVLLERSPCTEERKRVFYF